LAGSYSSKTGLLDIQTLSNCSTVAIDREQHKGWNGAWVDLKAVDPLTGEIKKSVHVSYPNYEGSG
jgi:hypothetical protein